MVENLLKYNSVLISVWSREIFLKNHLSDPLLFFFFFSPVIKQQESEHISEINSTVRDRSGGVQVGEVAISLPSTSSQTCHGFCNSSLLCRTIQAHYFWHATALGGLFVCFSLVSSCCLFCVPFRQHSQKPSAVLI